MFKKLTSLFLFVCLSSLQAMELPKYLDYNDVVQESFNQFIALFSQFPGLAKLSPKKPITHESTQTHYMVLLGAIAGRSMIDVTAIAFHNNMDIIQPIKKSLEEIKKGYLIAVDINKIGQDIKNIFNVTEPTIIYYHKTEEIARSTNFDRNNVLHNIKKNTAFAQGIEIPRFAEMKNLMQETYDGSIAELSQNPYAVKFLPKNPITYELIQFRFLTFLGMFILRNMLGITIVAFNNNAQQIEELKKFVEQQKFINSIYLISADINKVDQEIKNVFNITTEPTVIYYIAGQELVRSTNFDIKNVEQHIAAIFMQLPKLQPQKNK